ncbi:MAG: dockerin type I repeat-containing protein [Clostridia bacterium]|nr:dockerin type I repeat-containing protein [Clostridia bacterium]
MNKRFLSRVAAVLLTLAMVVTMFPIGAFAAEDAAQPIVVIACSDFQSPSGDAASAANVSAILTKIKQDYPTADGFICCGDYSYSLPTPNIANSVAALRNTVEGVYGTGLAEVLIQGNHDQQTPSAANGLSVSGAHDTADYGVFVINEDDYQWKSATDQPMSETVIKQTAANLKAYMDAKVDEGYTKPIFVASHVPLHYSVRTEADGDGKYGRYLFDVLNNAGANGLNIVFLFGHNHSNGWDNYMGGAATFYTKGQSINVAAYGSQTNYTAEALNFTYMNAGFIGYYVDNEAGSTNTSGVDDTLTMSVFEITDNTLTVKRYDANGIHNLKSAGVKNVKRPTTATNSQLDTTVIQSPYEIELTANQKNTLTDADTGISVTSYAEGPLTVKSVYPNAGFENIERFEAYDITIADFMAGDKATVSIPVPADYDTKRVRVYHEQNGNLTDMNATVKNGKATFTTTHFSVYLLAELSVEELDWRTIPGEKTFVYELDTDGVDAGNPYLIVAPSAAYALGTDLQRKSVELSSNDTIIKTENRDYEWTIDGNNPSTNTTATAAGTVTAPTTNGTQSYTQYNNNGYYYELNGAYDPITNLTCQRSGYTTNTRTYTWRNGNTTIKSGTGTANQTLQLYKDPVTTTTYANYYIHSGNTYLRRSSSNNNNASLTTGNASTNYRTWLIDSGSNGNYAVHSTDTNGRYIRYSSTSFSLNNTTSNRLRLYTYKEEINVVGGYAALDGDMFIFPITRFTSQAAVESYIREHIKVYFATAEDGSDAVEVTDYDFSGTLRPTIVGSDLLSVSYKGVHLGDVEIEFVERVVDSISFDVNGTVAFESKHSEKTGSTLHVVYADGTTDDIPVTVDMIVGGPNLVKTAGDYTDLTISYGGKTVSGYSLTVVAEDFPKNPNPGAVTIHKTATGLNFQETGVAQVELSAQGIPYTKGVDVIVMLDTSSSMTYGDSSEITAAPAGSQRIDMVHTALEEMITNFKKPDANGAVPDVRVAIADFNGYTYLKTSNVAQDRIGTSSIPTSAQVAEIFTGRSTATSLADYGDLADAFVDISSKSTSEWHSLVNSINTESGTNYDYAFDTVYEMGAAIQARNEAEGIDRDLCVVFMSDGCPFQYNYVVSHSSTSAWNDYLTGNFNPDDYSTITHKEFYNAATGNSHRMADAIKGEPSSDYEVIKIRDGAYSMEEVPGLGASLYSIGFCIYDDTTILQSTTQHVIENIASVEEGKRLYYDARNQSELSTAFSQIVSQYRNAATNAVFKDKMGSEYNLKLSPIYNIATGEKVGDSSIEIVTYDIWTRQEYLEGSCTIDQVGTRKSSAGTLVERVTFTGPDRAELGATEITGAYSNLIGASTNILQGNKIVAQNFTYDLETETFDWTLGTIHETEYALRYYVYLDGTGEKWREAGVYPTNEYADLHYTNYAGKNVVQEAPIPTMPWDTAVVYYAFYLVNENGQPVDSNGNVTSFANRIPVTNVQLGDKVYFHDQEEIDAGVVAQDTIPTEYSLYDEQAKYNIRVSTTGNSYWRIRGGDVPVDSTYVTDYDPSNPNAFTNATDVNSTNYNYARTTVWFAVVYKVSTIPDAVVIDYGVPVNISVLANDMFYNNGTLVGLCEEQSEMRPSDSISPKTTYNGKFGVATVHGNKVSYQLNEMKMTESETFSYIVNYQGDENTLAADKGYYYGTITVIPATIIYYEDSSVSYDGDWEQTANASAVQAEDRPGTNSLVTIDANNVYGFDKANDACAEYSLGGYHKATVTADNPIDCSFTFTGTGFDIISRTDNTAGFIVVTVTDEGGNRERSMLVNNYYQATDGTGAICEVPVVKIGNLPYGTHNVTVSARYNAFADEEGHGSTTFVMDAIRIYDPAGYTPADEVVKQAYIADHEYHPTFTTVRNLLVGQNAYVPGSSVSGACFVERAGSEVTIADYGYTNGPNNECYLKNGQGIAFTVVNVADLASIQIGAKSQTPGAVLSVSIQTGGIAVKSNKWQINTSTDMYYDLSNYVAFDNVQTCTIVISNTGSGLLALTNLKTTEKADALEAGPHFLVNRTTVDFAENMIAKLSGADYDELYVTEDINGDGVIDVRDMIRLKKIMAGAVESQMGDVNRDGYTDAVDMAVFKQTIFENL